MFVVPVQPTIDFTGRFGIPRLQRFRVNERLRLSVEYRPNGRISAIEIAPAEYRGYNFSQTAEVPSEAANSILEKILPGITINGLAVETTVTSTYPGFSREVRSGFGASLTRDYPLGDDRSRMMAAGLEISSADVASTASEVTAPMGEPEYLQFAADSGLAVGVFPSSQSSVRQIVISAQESLLAHPDFARPIESGAAEKLLTELLPSPVGTDEPWKSIFRSGGYKVERFHFREFVVCRSYVSDDMTWISIGWPIV